jgi:hypothetical protein
MTPSFGYAMVDAYAAFAGPPKRLDAFAGTAPASLVTPPSGASTGVTGPLNDAVSFTLSVVETVMSVPPSPPGLSASASTVTVPPCWGAGFAVVGRRVVKVGSPAASKPPMR